MSLFDNLSLQDLMADGPRGDELRGLLGQAVAGGEADAGLGVQLAQVALDGGKLSLALDFLALAIEGNAASESGWPDLLRRVVSTLVVAGDTGEARADEALGRVLAGIDGLASHDHASAMDTLVIVFSKHPDEAAALLARTMRGATAASAETVLALHFATRQFMADIVGAMAARDRLKTLPRLRSWTVRALIRFALATEDYAEAETLCERVIEQNGDHVVTLCDLAMALWCQGKRAEARAVSKRVVILMSSEKLAARHREIATWTEQLQKAIADGTEDGGDMSNIGAAVRYTRPDLVRKLYDEHVRDCGPENALRTISGFTNTVMFERIEALLDKHADIRKVVNYGTLAGLWEDRLAQKHPETLWAGYDIAPLATRWNDGNYRRGNLVFSSDLDGLLADLATRPGETLFAHCRTTDVMLPGAVKKVYRACHAHGVKWILTAEYFCRSMVSLDFPDFENDPVDTAHWDGILMMHNYAKIFPEMGYRLIHDSYRPVALLLSASGEGLTLDQMIRFTLAVREG